MTTNSPSPLRRDEDSAMSEGKPRGSSMVLGAELSTGGNRSYPLLHDGDWEPWDEPGDIGWRCRICGAVVPDDPTTA